MQICEVASYIFYLRLMTKSKLKVIKLTHILIAWQLCSKTFVYFNLK